MASSSTRRVRQPGEQNPFCKRRLAEGLNMEVPIPAHFRCPISLDLMRDPVTASTGITYDRQSIERWLEMGNSTCPVTNQELTGEELLIPNHSLRRMIQDWCVANRCYGVERIPTPRIPVTPTQVSEILSEIASASECGDRARCAELVARVRTLAKESERNRRCIVSGGAGRVLAASFSTFAGKSFEGGGSLEDMLSVLVGVFPLDEEACWYIGSPESLNCMVMISKCGDLAARLNTVLVLNELLVFSKEIRDLVAGTEGLIEALFDLIKEPISTQATKASLAATYYLVTSDEKTATRFVEMGLLPLLLEILIDSEKSTSEKALAVFDGICSSERGREAAYSHALTVPVLVKKMFRVSDMATELVVSALWKLCKNYKKEEGGVGGFLVEALQMGAFQKLLLLLQVGCSGGAKEKATDMMKLLNGFKGALDCIDTMDQKGLRRPLY